VPGPLCTTILPQDYGGGVLDNFSPVTATSASARHGASLADAAAGATVRYGRVGRPVPRAFLGLSLEDSELPHFAASSGVFGRVVSLLRPHGGAPLLLRIGGASADLTWWEPRSRRRPPNVEAIGASWLSGLGRLVRAAPI
jgi:hypothetical protein